MHLRITLHSGHERFSFQNLPLLWLCVSFCGRVTTKSNLRGSLWPLVWLVSRPGFVWMLPFTCWQASSRWFCLKSQRWGGGGPKAVQSCWIELGCGWVVGSGFLDLVLACWGAGLFHYMSGYSFWSIPWNSAGLLGGAGSSGWLKDPQYVGANVVLRWVGLRPRRSQVSYSLTGGCRSRSWSLCFQGSQAPESWC